MLIEILRFFFSFAWDIVISHDGVWVNTGYYDDQLQKGDIIIRKKIPFKKTECRTETLQKIAHNRQKKIYRKPE